MKLLKDKKLYKTSFLHEEYNLHVLKKLDPITYKHSLNVANYAVPFAKFANNCSESSLYYSGLFHDIGKTQIDFKLLNKTSTLYKDEFVIMQQHPTIGQTILYKSGLPNEVLEAVQFHHERYDGKGYPMGFKGDSIPLLARIISICDVFDALTSDRPYRKAHSADNALRIMSNSEGQFDPELFSIFIFKIAKVIYSELFYRSGDFTL